VKLRLSHILVLMALVLAAGVLSVGHLEADVGASTVPGVVVVEVPGLDLALADRLQQRLPGASREWVPAGEGPLQPFGTELAARRAAEGAAALLVGASPLPDPATTREGWRVLIDTSSGAAGEGSAAQRAARVNADFVRQQDGVRAFLAALDPGPPGPDATATLAELLEPLIAAADALPRIRRTAIVLLGERDGAGQRRLVLRWDRGRWGLRARPLLDDLVDEAW
jgi:hypothetical protein